MMLPDDEGYIVAAAIKQGNMICSVPKPGRHHDVIRGMARAGIPIPIDGEQGFLTSEGLFVGRKLAKDIALMAGQILSKNGDQRQLFSEDVW
jgi:hypothetical protein